MQYLNLVLARLGLDDLQDIESTPADASPAAAPIGLELRHWGPNLP
jgi:hypothetical protein